MNESSLLKRGEKGTGAGQDAARTHPKIIRFRVLIAFRIAPAPRNLTAIATESFAEDCLNELNMATTELNNNNLTVKEVSDCFSYVNKKITVLLTAVTMIGYSLLGTY